MKRKMIKSAAWFFRNKKDFRRKNDIIGTPEWVSEW